MAGKDQNPGVAEHKEFARWWVKAEPVLFRLASYYVRSPDAARELVQDIAVLALRNLTRFTSDKEFYSWANARLHWLALDELRIRKSRHPGPGRPTPQFTEPRQEQDLLIRELLGFIEKLPSRQREALLGMLEGKPNETIARNLEISEATVRSLQRFARKRLITLLGEKGGY